MLFSVKCCQFVTLKLNLFFGAELFKIFFFASLMFQRLVCENTFHAFQDSHINMKILPQIKWNIHSKLDLLTPLLFIITSLYGYCICYYKNCTCIKYFFSILFIIWAGYKTLPFCVPILSTTKQKRVDSFMYTKGMHMSISLYILHYVSFICGEPIHDVAKYRVAHKDSIARNCVLHSTWCILFRHHHIYRRKIWFRHFSIPCHSFMPNRLHICVSFYVFRIYIQI